MNQIPTANNLANQLRPFIKNKNFSNDVIINFISDALKMFALLHVQAALQAAYNKSKLKELEDSDSNEELKCYIENDMGDVYILDKDSIFNSYSEENIK